MSADLNIDGGDSPENFVYSILCIFAAYLFHNLSTLAADIIWIWAFRALSAISLLIVLFINIPKTPEAWQGWKKIFKK